MEDREMRKITAVKRAGISLASLVLAGLPQLSNAGEIEVEEKS
jgi:hypothetical protein